MIVSRSSPFFSSVSNARSSSSLHCADVMARVRLRVLLILSAFIQVRIAGLLPSLPPPNTAESRRIALGDAELGANIPRCGRTARTPRSPPGTGLPLERVRRGAARRDVRRNAPLAPRRPAFFGRTATRDEPPIEKAPKGSRVACARSCPSRRLFQREGAGSIPDSGYV